MVPVAVDGLLYEAAPNPTTLFASYPSTNIITVKTIHSRYNCLVKESTS
jgi:hypothetical protein